MLAQIQWIILTDTTLCFNKVLVNDEINIHWLLNALQVFFFVCSYTVN